AVDFDIGGLLFAQLFETTSVVAVEAPLVALKNIEALTKILELVLQLLIRFSWLSDNLGIFLDFKNLKALTKIIQCFLRRIVPFLWLANDRSLLLDIPAPLSFQLIDPFLQLLNLAFEQFHLRVFGRDRRGKGKNN
ncbi:MAG: hypothetical protein PVI98_15105, partial [Burkholderiales bacterium]